MSVLIWGVIFFAAAFFLHLVIWRLHLPTSPIKALVFIFSSVALLGLIFLFSRKLYSSSQYLHIIVLFSSLFICYLLTYSAIDADSPSLVIVLRISKAGKEGLPYNAIKGFLRDDLLIEPRLKDLAEARLVDFNGQIYKINQKGKIFIFPFMLYRNLLGLGKGG